MHRASSSYQNFKNDSLIKTVARQIPAVSFTALCYYYYYYYTGEDYSDTVTTNAAGALYKIKLNT